MEQIEDNLLFEQVDKALRKNEPVNIRLFSQSMYPFLNPYTDILTLSPSDTNRLHIGDVVLAKIKSGYILHRLISKTKYGWCLLQGDGNTRKIESVYVENVIGVLSAIERTDTGVHINCYSIKWRLYGWCWIKLRFCRTALLKIIYFKRSFNH